MRSPLPDSIMRHRFNRTLHGRSRYRPKDVPGHNVIKGYNTPGTGDALDIFATAGTPVFAMAEGRVTRIAEPDGRLGAIYVSSGNDTVVYAHVHVQDSIKLGDRILKGQKLGYINRKIADPHLHVEVWTNGKAVSSNTVTGLARKIDALID